MSKEKQIEEMKRDLIEIFDEEYEKRRIITADFTAIKMTAKGYHKQSKPISCGHENGGAWISVEERLPEPYDKCLVAIKVGDKNEVDLAERVKCFDIRTNECYYEWLITNDWDECEITHWMPLPEAPKGGAK